MLEFLLASDFDGVLCDGLQEYFWVAWRTYCALEIDRNCSVHQPPQEKFDLFSRCRAVIETGWEMPLLIHVLQQERSEAEILDRWSEIVKELQESAEIPSPKILAAQLDQIRDRWIEEDLAGWLALHRFYPGVLSWLQILLAQEQPIAIVSTKEGRFIHQLLSQSGIDFPHNLIFGKEVRQPKPETLRQLITAYPHLNEIYFVEDRLATLQSVKAASDLQNVQLFLADWGYNTPQDRFQATQDDRIQCLSLEDLALRRFGYQLKAGSAGLQPAI